MLSESLFVTRTLDDAGLLSYVAQASKPSPIVVCSPIGETMTNSASSSQEPPMANGQPPASMGFVRPDRRCGHRLTSSQVYCSCYCDCVAMLSWLADSGLHEQCTASLRSMLTS